MILYELKKKKPNENLCAQQCLSLAVIRLRGPDSVKLGPMEAAQSSSALPDFHTSYKDNC